MTGPFAIAGGGPAASSYSIDYSCAFDEADSDRFDRTLGGDGNLRTWTFSVWFKLNEIQTGGQHFFSAGDGTQNDDFNIYINNTGGGGQGPHIIAVNYATGGSQVAVIKSNELLRDPASWYHLVVGIDTIDGTASNRFRFHLNRHSPYTIQIRGNRTTFPPPRELYPLCSHPMA